MKQFLFWLDLAFCSLWMLIALANCSWWSLPAHLFMVVAVVMRIALSFSLYRREKRSWISLMVFTVLFVLLLVVGQVMDTACDLINLPFIVLGIPHDHLTHKIIHVILLAWLFLGPLTVYIVGLCRKTLTASTLTWKDALGAILWKDKGAKTYCLLMLAAVCALYAGLAMDMRMCRFACIVLPSLSLYLIARHTAFCKGTSEKGPMVGKLWLMVAAMVLFFCAQRYAGMWRVWMLLVSISLVAYVCWQTIGKQGLAGRSIVATAYLGILLPTFAIGYNQYACIDYGRRGLYTLEPFRGVFFIKDLRTDKIGLRDRYGMLVEPVYDNIVHNLRNLPLGVYELRNNGCYTLYNVSYNEMMKSNVSDQNLQDSICQLLDKYCDSHDYDHRDRLEVRVTSKYNSEAILSHVKITRDGSNSYYDYRDGSFILEDSVSLRSRELATDSILQRGDTYHVLHYSYDVKRDSVVLYNIELKSARQTVVQKDAFAELAKDIEALLK